METRFLLFSAVEIIKKMNRIKAMTIRKRRILLIICVLVFLIITPLLNFYLAGYRLTRGFKITKTGGMYIYSPENGVKIYINNELKKETGFIQNGYFIQNMKPGKYSIIVAKDGFWPWKKDLNVKEEIVSETRSFLVKKEPEGKTIVRGLFSEIYASPDNKILTLIEKNKKTSLNKMSFYLPESDVFLNAKNIQSQNIYFSDIIKTKWEENSFIILADKSVIKYSFDLGSRTFEAQKLKENKESEESIFKPREDFSIFKSNEMKIFDYGNARISGRKKEIIWLDKTRDTIWFDVSKEESDLPYFIYQEEEKTLPFKVFISKYKIKNIEFFPGRRDIIIVAINNGVYAMELDGRGGRIIQPIYKGKNPNFALFKGDKKIYVLDDGNLSYIDF